MSLPCTSSQAPPSSQGPSPAQVRNRSRQFRPSRPSHLAAVRHSLSSLGASQGVVDMVSQAHRLGTQGVYSSHWSRWLRWSQDNQVDPCIPSRIQVANFVAFLSTDLSISASSIKVHRAAICTTLRQLGGPSLSDDPLLRDLVCSASIRDARNPRRTPSWDLLLVLSALWLAPYEPIREIPLKFLTLKTVFLVALASGQRCSEVHALSGLPSDVASDPDGSFSLSFLPEFLAKNQSPGDPSPVIHIKALTSILCPDDEDCTLCPVRAMRIYRRRPALFARPTAASSSPGV